MTAFLLMAVMMILVLPLRWLIASAVAASVHELGHYTAVRLFGGTVRHVRIGSMGAQMEAFGLNTTTEIICLLAGPVAGLLLTLFFRYCPIVAICAMVQSSYNLLPVYPLDGGRVLRHIVIRCSGTDFYFRIIEYVVLTLLLFLCVYIRIHFGISLFLYFGILLYGKIPCKPRKDWI